jgi:uncharacterized membrane protein YraQ (UPF0718 family)
MISQILEILLGVLNYLIQTFAANWFILLFGIIIAVLISVYVDAEKTRKLFLRRPRFLILGSVLFGALTPLCACGTMAVVLSLITSTIPWGAIMAFLVSSPLMSPDTFVMLSGFLGLKFAIALTVSSIILGLGGGWITHWIEHRTSFLNNQLRLSNQQKESSIQNCCEKETTEFVRANKQRVPMANLGLLTLNVDKSSTNSCCNIDVNEICCSEKSNLKYAGENIIESLNRISNRFKLRKVITSFIDLGIVKVLPLFILFVVIAYLVKEFVPTEWIVTLFSGEHFYSIPLAALIGLPMYVSDATVVPLLQVLRDAGASDGAILAYMISGPATSIGVIGGLSVIMKRRAILLYVTIILIGAILLGYGYNFLIVLL